MFKRHRSEKSNRYQWLLLERGIQDWIFTKVHGNLIPIQKNQFLSDTCLKDIALTIKSIGVELLINNRWYLIEAQRYNRHSIILRIFDITDEKALLLVDPLTQLYNHNYLTEIDSNYRYCVIVDIRDFVTINRTYSYQYGDNLLKSLASQFNLLAPLVLRDYSDNFVLFTDEIDLLLGKIETVYQQLELNYYLGYARRYYESTSELYAKADRALHWGIDHQIKITNWVPEINKEWYKLVEINNALQDLANNSYLIYQPIYQDKGIQLGLEALLRLETKSFGSVAPREYFDRLQQTRLLGDTAKIVLDLALTEINKKFGRLHINLSRVELESPKLTKGLLSILDIHNVNPRQIILEFDQYPDNLEIVNELKESGFKLCLDNFGGDHNSLIDLLNFDDFIKIDQKLLPQNSNDLTEIKICQHIRSLTKSLGIRVIVNGINTKMQLDLMTELGYRYFQGYYFGKPQRYELIN